MKLPRWLALLLLAAINTPPAPAEKLLFDFATATDAAVWQVVNDDVMGGGSHATFGLTNSVAVFRGEVCLENNGGFASVCSQPAALELAGASEVYSSAFTAAGCGLVCDGSDTPSALPTVSRRVRRPGDGTVCHLEGKSA